jgi:hypothetical protein
MTIPYLLFAVDHDVVVLSTVVRDINCRTHPC